MTVHIQLEQPHECGSRLNDALGREYEKRFQACGFDVTSVAGET